MPVKMKKEIRKRVAGHIGATQEDMHKAESECDGELFLYPVDTKGTLGGFYLLHVPVNGKIAPTLFPTEYFVKQKEDEEGTKENIGAEQSSP